MLKSPVPNIYNKNQWHIVLKVDQYVPFIRFAFLYASIQGVLFLDLEMLCSHKAFQISQTMKGFQIYIIKHQCVWAILLTPFVIYTSIWQSDTT